jgi:phage repressor protein C with HTH and peptisase S24 domain
VRWAAGHGTVNQPRTEPLEWIFVPERLKPTDGVLMALEVHGDSMEPEICPGDIVVVWYPTNQPAMRLLDNGQLVVVTVEGPGEEYEDYLKRYWLDPDTGKDELISTNPAYEPLEIPLQPLYVGQVKMIIKM